MSDRGLSALPSFLPVSSRSPAPLSICPAPTDKQHVGETVRWDAGIYVLLERTFLASTPADCEGCLPDIARALASATQPLERARLLTCRARVRSLQLHFREACDDCAAAVALFESAGADSELAVDAASLGAAHAARLNNVALASELATKSILGLDSVTDDRLRMEITNRLGVFCYYYLDYDGAVEQFEVSLAAAERVATANASAASCTTSSSASAACCSGTENVQPGNRHRTARAGRSHGASTGRRGKVRPRQPRRPPATAAAWLNLGDG